jgi:Na+-translocating ferredoxin:NAD+ oxidoreductase RnfG subunit
VVPENGSPLTNPLPTMKNLTKSVALLVMLVILAAPASAQIAKTGTTTTLKDALKVMLQDEGAAGLKKLTVNVSGEQAKGLTGTHGVDTEGSYTVYNGTKADGSVMGTVVVVNQAGKEGPLQVLVALRPDGTVYDVGFTVFGEDKGKPALNWSFLKQFVGKKVTQPVTIGDDVDGISGATWTSTSVATAVKRALAVYKEFITA